MAPGDWMTPLRPLRAAGPRLRLLPGLSWPVPGLRLRLPTGDPRWGRQWPWAAPSRDPPEGSAARVLSAHPIKAWPGVWLQAPPAQVQGEG